MYGMSAKDRLKMFEKKEEPKKPLGSGPKKVGKLSIGTKKTTEKKETEVKKKSTTKKDDAQNGSVVKDKPLKDEKEATKDVKADSKTEVAKVEESKKTEQTKEPRDQGASKEKEADTAKLKQTKKTDKDEPKKVDTPKPKDDPKKKETSKLETTKPKEEAKKVETPKPKEAKKVETPKPKEEPKKVETPKPKEEPKKVETPKPKEEPKKVETPKPKEEPKKVETPKPKEEHKKVETPKPKEEPKKVETPKPKEEPKKVEKPKPKEEPKKVETPKPKEEPKKVETPKPKEEPKKVETPKPKEEPKKVETPKPKEEPKKVETPKPKEEPKKVETPKPKEEPKKVEAPKPKEVPNKVEAPKPKEEPKKVETPKPKEEPKKTEQPKPKEEPSRSPSLIVDDLDLDSELEANLGIMSDVELQSPTGVPVQMATKTAPLPQQATQNAEVKKASVDTTDSAKITEKNIPSKGNEQVKPEAQKVVETSKTKEAPKQVETQNQKTQSKSAPVSKPKEDPAKAEAPKSKEDSKKVETPNKMLDSKPVCTLEVEHIPPSNIEMTKVQPNEKPAMSVEAIPKTEVALTSGKKESQTQEAKIKEQPTKPPQTPSQKQTENKVKEDAPKVAVSKEAVETKAPPTQSEEDIADKEVSTILDEAVNESEQAPPEQVSEVIMSKSFTESTMPSQEFKPIPEEFYNTIFYFSGMGSVVGSALAEGVYVAENTARISLDNDEVQYVKGHKPQSEVDKETVIKTARTQATDINRELKGLHSLLDTLPTFLDTGVDTQPLVRPSEKPLRGQRLPPIAGPDNPPWVKRTPAAVPVHAPPPPQRKIVQNGIPTWNQQVQDGLALMGQKQIASAPGQPGIWATPFVPPAMRDGSNVPKAPLSKPEPQQTAPQKQEEQKQEEVTNRLTEDSDIKQDPMSSPINEEEQTKTVSEPVAAPQSESVSVEQNLDAPDTGQVNKEPSLKVEEPAAGDTRPSDTTPSTSVETEDSSLRDEATNGPATWTPPAASTQVNGHKPGAIRSDMNENVSARQPGQFLGMTDSNQPGQKIAPKEHQSVHSGVRPFGVHTAESDVSSQPWQERYGQKKAPDAPPPKPFTAGTVQSKGLKPWQLSRLRTLEAQGYVVKQPEGYDTYAQLSSKSEQDLPSLTPFLVSSKSKNTDLKAFHQQSARKPTAQVQTPVMSGSFRPNLKPKSKSISAPNQQGVSSPSVRAFHAPNVNFNTPSAKGFIAQSTGVSAPRAPSVKASNAGSVASKVVGFSAPSKGPVASKVKSFSSPNVAFDASRHTNVSASSTFKAPVASSKGFRHVSAPKGYSCGPVMTNIAVSNTLPYCDL